MLPQQRHHSVSEYDGRSPSSHSGSNYQGFVANQRYGPRPNEAESMLQAKRRAAAQRERELRNYHQEQQYNRSRSSNLVVVQHNTKLTKVSQARPVGKVTVQ